MRDKTYIDQKNKTELNVGNTWMNVIKTSIIAKV